MGICRVLIYLFPFHAYYHHCIRILLGLSTPAQYATINYQNRLLLRLLSIWSHVICIWFIPRGSMKINSFGMVNSVRFRCRRTEIEDSTVCFAPWIQFHVYFALPIAYYSIYPWLNSLNDNNEHLPCRNICFVGLNPELFYGQFPWHPSARLLFGFSLCVFFSLLSLWTWFQVSAATRRFDYIQIYGHETVVFSIIIYLFIILVIGVLLSCYCCRRCRPRSTQSPFANWTRRWRWNAFGCGCQKSER